MTYTDAVAAFVSDATWLGTADAPAVTILESLAEALDQEVTAALVAQYGLTYRSLLKRAPVAGSGEVDPVDALIAGARA